MNTPSRRKVFALGLGALSAALWQRATSGVNGEPNIDALLARTHAFLISLNAPDLAPFLRDWPRTSQRRTNVPASLPVLRWLPQIKADAPPSSATLVGKLSKSSTELTWHQTYKQPVVGAAFLDNYGYTELAGLIGPVPSQRLACGFLLLGPSIAYRATLAKHAMCPCQAPRLGSTATRAGAKNHPVR